jgi:hypothetical protein
MIFRLIDSRITKTLPQSAAGARSISQMRRRRYRMHVLANLKKIVYDVFENQIRRAD